MATPKPKLKLRPFQERVFKAVLEGENVILQAPTGAGKTRAALAPFLQNLAQGGDRLPLTCRYAVPLRVLARQFFNEYEFAGKNIDQAMDARLCATYKKFDQKPVHIQTGEQPLDPQFESALTFCTIDQLLASFLAIPYGLGKRRANLNVGGIIGSYLVFDEFHLYPLTRDGKSAWGARTSVLQMLHMLNRQKQKLTPFVMMTATFSTHLIKELAQLLDAAIISIAAEPEQEGQLSELDVLNAGRQRFFIVHDAPMDVGTILDQHDGCSLVVCNTVLRAQQIYLELRKQLAQERGSTKLILLHSRFTDKDREDKQDKLEQALGNSAWRDDDYHDEDLIVVATQVVEVGLDISVRALHTEAAPANSIIQRAGRCARFANQRGQVHIYPIRPNEREKISYLPYDEAKTEATRAAFARFSNEHVGFQQEQEVIDLVHGEEDRALLEAFRQDRLLIRQKMFQGFSAHDRGIASQLIREVQQVTLLIHDDPNAAITERPWEWQTFTLSPYTLESRWQTLLDAAGQARDFGDDRPIAWEARLDETVQEQGERIPMRYIWEQLKVPTSIPRALMLALSPDIASYSSELGLLLRDGRLTVEWPARPYQSQPVERGETRKKPFYGYDQESYAEHIGGLLNAYRFSRLRDDVAFVAARLEHTMNLPKDSIDWAIRLAIACHDIGKLGQGWQSWAHTWQVKLVEAFSAYAEQYQPRKAPFAHTDYDPRQHGELERRLKLARPNHACESAYLAGNLIFEATGDQPLARAVIAAIAHHHNATSTEYAPIRLIPDARRYVGEMLDLVAEGLPWRYDIGELEYSIDMAGKLDKNWITILHEHVDQEMWLYFIIVRALRLADGRSFAFR